jgi:hypothetical protein
MIDAVGIEERCATLDPVDDVAFPQQKFGEVCAVLAGDARDERAFLHWNYAWQRFAENYTVVDLAGIELAAKLICARIFRRQQGRPRVC